MELRTVSLIGGVTEYLMLFEYIRPPYLPHQPQGPRGPEDAEDRNLYPALLGGPTIVAP